MTTFVLVHGAFVGGWYWDEVRARLEKAGHVVDAPQLLSSGPDPTALGDLAADTDLVRGHIESAGEPVVLVGHSYGGMVVTELADHPDVVHGVYVAALWPAAGTSANDLMATLPPLPWAVPQEDGTLRAVDDVGVLHRAICADVPRERAEPLLRRMRPQSLASLGSPSSAPERMHPVTYVICANDASFPPEAQERMAAAADHVERLPSSHAPMFSLPDELAELLGRIR
ncbi:alpha/beta hydrolase [Pseudonocardia sp. RS11V-5]|uniref:alpha/beta fold hydrolase n=1 Tax=Pseudonocardia terrae TaxID=2905831 RepID=UPI001E2D7A15|nr:alpha/beta hydrolase [Pseudonocardia terrae]MCE3555961.1 alpha/beta hydrolase [Pseudonocardia terrae]